MINKLMEISCINTVILHYLIFPPDKPLYLYPWPPKIMTLTPLPLQPSSVATSFFSSYFLPVNFTRVSKSNSSSFFPVEVIKVQRDFSCKFTAHENFR